MTREARLTIRPAAEQDQIAIRALVRSERLNPHRLDWPNFFVAEDQCGLVGAVQLRKHWDGSRELGSLVVRKDARQQAIASRLIDALLAGTNEPIFMVTAEAFAGRYQRWGFRRIEPSAASAAVRRNYRIGSLVSITALFTLRRIRRLVILGRDAGAPMHAIRQSTRAPEYLTTA